MSNQDNIIKLGDTAISPSENETPVFYTPAEVAKLLQCSMPTVYQIMHRQDFPLVKVGNHLRVYKKAFEKWAMERRD